MDEYSKNEILFSEAIGVCRTDIDAADVEKFLCSEVKKSLDDF